MIYHFGSNIKLNKNVKKIKGLIRDSMDEKGGHKSDAHIYVQNRIVEVLKQLYPDCYVRKEYDIPVINPITDETINYSTDVVLKESKDGAVLLCCEVDTMKYGQDKSKDTRRLANRDELIRETYKCRILRIETSAYLLDAEVKQMIVKAMS